MDIKLENSQLASVNLYSADQYKIKLERRSTDVLGLNRNLIYLAMSSR